MSRPTLPAVLLVTMTTAWACGGGEVPPPAETPPPPVDRGAAFDEEGHFGHVRQLTFGGENAEAYFSFDGAQLIFQSTREGVPCDQIFTMNTDGSDLQMVSTGEGRTTCGYFTPQTDAIVYASTHLGGAECPPPPSFEFGYVWAIYDTYDIFRASPDGSGLTALTETAGYDAEATVGPDGRIASRSGAATTSPASSPPAASGTAPTRAWPWPMCRAICWLTASISRSTCWAKSATPSS